MYRFVALAQRGKCESLGISQAHEAVSDGKWRVLITAAVCVKVVRREKICAKLKGCYSTGGCLGGKRSLRLLLGREPQVLPVCLHNIYCFKIASYLLLLAF